MLDAGRIDRGEARRRLGLKPDAQVVLFFGFLRDEKRLEDLLEGFRLARRRLSQAVLLVQSELSYSDDRRAWLEAQALQPGVHVHVGYASLAKVEALFRAADVVALPYERPGASGVLNLARAFARPVVVSDGFELAPTLHGTCGLSIPPRNPGALADSLVELLEMSEDQRQCLCDGWAGVMGAESWSNAAQALWTACVSDPKSPEDSMR
jgi:glycosyltransferase involved in cell wall biosynthesis